MKQGSSDTEKILNVWAVVLILWSLYRAQFRTELPIWIDEFIAKPVIFLLPVYIFVKKIEKQPFFSSLALTRHGNLKELAIGLFIGSLFFLIGILGRMTNLVSAIHVIQLLLISFATSFSEEVLSRGFILKRLYESSRNALTSSFLVSILFFLLHVPILFTSASMTGNLLIKVMVTDILLSLVVSFIFLMRKNLVTPIIVHALYSLSLYLFI